MDITALYQIFLSCTGVTTDSRNCPEGSLFIALKGDTFNGNAFAAKALETEAPMPSWTKPPMFLPETHITY